MDENVSSTVHKIDAKILSSGMSTNKHVTLLLFVIRSKMCLVPTRNFLLSYLKKQIEFDNNLMQSFQNVEILDETRRCSFYFTTY